MTLRTLIAFFKMTKKISKKLGNLKIYESQKNVRKMLFKMKKQ